MTQPNPTPSVTPRSPLGRRLRSLGMACRSAGNARRLEHDVIFEGAVVFTGTERQIRRWLDRHQRLAVLRLEGWVGAAV